MSQYFDVTAARPALQWSWLTISGRDASDFLHRISTVHVSGLEVGQGAPGFFLNAQGKIRAYFNLWRFDAEGFAFEFDAGANGHWKQELLATIDQYTFAEKFALADITALESRWLFADPGEEQALLQALGASGLRPGRTVAVDEEIRLCHHGDIDFGRPWLTAWGRPARLAQWLERALPQASSLGWAEIERWRILAGRPRVDAELNESTIPLEAGLTEALAQSKGCYPGQEVIEKIISLGAPPRRLVRIEGSGQAPAPGSPILNLADPPSEVGQVTSVAPDDGGKFMALGYVRKIHAKQGLEVRFAAQGARGSIAQVSPHA